MSEQYDISFENAEGEMVDAIESKNRFATLRKNIATIWSKWLISGNGEGQRRNNEEGDTEHHNIPDSVLLDGGKASFLGDLHPYQLYAWEMFEKTDMMDGAMGMLDGSTTASGVTTPGEDSWGNKTLDRKHKREESRDEAMIDLARTVKEVFCEMKTQGHRNFLTSLEARRQKLLDDRHSLRGARCKSTDEEENDEIEEDLNLIMTDLKSIEEQIKEVEENIRQHEMQQETSNSHNNK